MPLRSSQVAHDPPRILQLTTRTGATITARVYEPEGAIHANVVIHCATACPQRFYSQFARYLSEAGLRVFTYDYRGIGDSRESRARRSSLRGESVTMADWALADARAMHEHIADHYPDVPLTFVGHSFGAQLVGLLDEAHAARAAVFVGASLAYCGHWPAHQVPVLRAWWKFAVPAFCRIFGYLPKESGLGGDLPRGVALQWARWCTHPDYLMSEFPEARARYARFACPLLAYQFTDDSYAPPRAAAALRAVLTGTRVVERALTPADAGASAVGHFGFFRLGPGRLWAEARDFLIDAAGARANASAPSATEPSATSSAAS